MAAKRDHLFEFGAVILIFSSIVSLALSFINLNNLVGPNFYDLPGFQVSLLIEKPPEYCFDQNFLSFAWTCGFISFLPLITGLMAFGVSEFVNFYNLVFLFLSGLSGLVGSGIIIVASSMVCICHVTITGDLPATNLFISIMAIFQVIFSLLLFVKVFKKRIEMNNDIKYGIEPLPDPFELTINPRNISYVQGSNKYIDGYDSLEERNFYNALSKKGGRFDSTFNNAQTTSNPSRFQISNGVKRQVFTNGAFLPVRVMDNKNILNAPYLGGVQNASNYTGRN